MWLKVKPGSGCQPFLVISVSSDANLSTFIHLSLDYCMCFNRHQIVCAIEIICSISRFPKGCMFLSRKMFFFHCSSFQIQKYTLWWLNLLFMLWLCCFPVGEHGEAAALQQVAEGLREIAAQLEHNVVAQATQNLRRNISTSPSEVSLNKGII